MLTDPPYFVRYTDRSGRTIRNDLYPGKVLDAFKDLFQVLKPKSLCISFYGWNRVDSFFSACEDMNREFAGVWHVHRNEFHLALHQARDESDVPRQAVKAGDQTRCAMLSARVERG